MDCNISANCLQTKLQKALQIIRKYDWLINAYVLDFYVDEHWEKLPASWRDTLEMLSPEHLTELLDDCVEVGDGVGVGVLKRVWPLSLLSLKSLLRDLCISRKPAKEDTTLPRSALLAHPKLKHIFTKCVKPKKRHEIERMAAFCKRSCANTPVDFVVDFGAGLGHLARVLGYGCGIRVCCLEMQEPLNVQAGIIDEQLESRASKYLPAMQIATFQRPTHVTLQLTAEMNPAEFLTTLRQALKLPNNEFRFGIIGLHPCGDLGAILMRMFLDCAQAKFLNFVGCCYMKLSTAKAHADDTIIKCGYPLSAHLQQAAKPNCDLSYEAREISCHALEMYVDRLRSGDFEYLRVHSFRAAAERILIKHSKALRHCGLRSVKHTPGMQFEDYFHRAVQGLATDVGDLPASALQSAATKADLLNWQRIVIFYTLRLMFAPLVECIILYDRILFLKENLCHVEINAIFDPRLSPRNHITSAVKLN